MFLDKYSKNAPTPAASEGTTFAQEGRNVETRRRSKGTLMRNQKMPRTTQKTSNASSTRRMVTLQQTALTRMKMMICQSPVRQVSRP